MNTPLKETPNEVFSRLAREPGFMDSAVKHLVAEQQKREAARKEFVASDAFRQIRIALEGLKPGTVLSSETGSYFPEQIAEELSLPTLSETDIQMFFSVMGDSQSADIEADSRKEDEECSFPNCSYKLYGLFVSILSGQGTLVFVSNAAFT